MWCAWYVYYALCLFFNDTSTTEIYTYLHTLSLHAALPISITVNVPRAKVRGFEFDGQINPTTWLRVGGAANFTDAKYTSNLVSVAGGPPIAFDTYSDVPKLSGAALTETFGRASCRERVCQYV